MMRGDPIPSAVVRCGNAAMVAANVCDNRPSRLIRKREVSAAAGPERQSHTSPPSSQGIRAPGARSQSDARTVLTGRKPRARGSAASRCSIVPYIYVDTDAAMAAGRFGGYPKKIADIQRRHFGSLWLGTMSRGMKEAKTADPNFSDIVSVSMRKAGRLFAIPLSGDKSPELPCWRHPSCYSQGQGPGSGRLSPATDISTCGIAVRRLHLALFT
jgi:hypothetical protein